MPQNNAHTFAREQDRKLASQKNEGKTSRQLRREAAKAKRPLGFLHVESDQPSC